MTELWLHSIALGGCGLAIGVGLGATGIGGFLLIPVLMHWLDLPIQAAIGTALASSVLSALWGLWLYRRQAAIETRVALPLALGGLAMGLAGGTLNARLPAAAVTALLGGVMVLASLQAFRRLRPTLPDAPVSVPWPTATAIGALAGLVAGLTGAGGPLVSVPLLLAVGYALPMAVGASQWLQLAASSSAIVPFLALGLVHWRAQALLIPLMCLGMWLGLALARRVSPARMKVLVATTGAITGLWMLERALGAT
jgi:uncharacterized membrane protein YfcA